jgi:hypothetical protein
MALASCGSVPLVRDVPKPIRTIVERAACDDASQHIADMTKRVMFLTACYTAADLYGAARAAVDGGDE